MKILVRTSGGRAPKKQLGLGHIFRSINLAKHLRPNSIYFLIEDFGGVKKIFYENNFDKIYNLKKNIEILEDIKKTKKIIQENKIDILIIDKYGLDSKYISSLKKFVKIVIISDLNKIDFDADLIFNGFIGFKNQIKKNRFNKKCFLGPSYQIINKKFSKKLKIQKKYDLLITLGGYDEKNIIGNLIKHFDDFILDFKIKIILGPSTKKLKEITKWQKKFKNNVEILSHTNDMQKEIGSTRFGICSGGITTYEFASQGVPFAIISQVKHQVTTAKEWEKNKIAINLGLIDNLSEKKVKKLLLKLKSKDFEFKNAQSIIDGKGAERISKKIISLNKKTTN